MRLRNVSGYPLEIRKYRVTVGPGEIIDTAELGHDMDRDGVITGMEPVEEPKQDQPAQSGKPKYRNARSGGDTDGGQQ